jgi:hypothetical protein
VIGVAAKEVDVPWVEEFFELFKTPWQQVVPGTKYRVVLSTDPAADVYGTALTLIYGAEELAVDRRLGARVEAVNGPVTVTWEQERIPVYGCAARFTGEQERTLRCGDAAAGYRRTCGHGTIHRFGYDLLAEVSYLLTNGQPRANAASPTLELHIDIIRHCLRTAQVPFVEIPPRPDNYSFVCCLTHDVDFFGVRRHAGDSTLAGFVSRALAGTVADVIRGRRPIDEAARNWLAVLSLPFVFLGGARDFWQPFEDYRRVEQGRRSTFFLIPFKGRPGTDPEGQSKPLRAAPYGIGEIRRDIEANANPATEFAVHGIDAWHDADAGTAERLELTTVTGVAAPGVRMHWLYFSPGSPQTLEHAGFAYDSTWGYNDAVGYRAGTAQVFQFARTRLLELPLTVMDTALFYFDRMGLSRRRAMERCQTIIQQLRRFGGTFVVNWHDRSLAPERQWTRPYQALLSELDSNGAWFAKAGEAVDWFRWRRSIRFTTNDASEVNVEAAAVPDGLPAARLVIHRSSDAAEHRFAGGAQTLHV